MKSNDNKNTSISIQGARVNNLQNISVEIPRNQLVVITGLSGSGKSSLAFDTLYAEGQRRYVESLSAYARQFLGRINKPDVDFITGIPPAIAIEQKVNTSNPRSTVGTSTEIYDYLKILYARIGKTISPISGREVRKHSVSDVVDGIMNFPDGFKLLLIAPLKPGQGSLDSHLTEFKKEGFSRILIDKKIVKIEDLKKPEEGLDKGEFQIVVDRVVVQHDEDSKSRFSDSAQTALLIGRGVCRLLNEETHEIVEYSVRFEQDGIEFEEPSQHIFSFNNPLGACPMCEGYGKVIGIDPDLVIPHKDQSVFNDAVACWKTDSFTEYKQKLIMNAGKFNFPIHKAYNELTPEQQKLLWTGNKYFEGLSDFFKYLESQTYKIQYRVMLARYRGKTVCPECNGSRLRKEASYIKVYNKSISELVLMPIGELKAFFSSIKLDEYDQQIAGRLLIEIRSRIDFLMNVGLSYLTLNRLSATLSGGESQRINLATALGSSLVGSLYILDEPSIGLHSRDTGLLIEVLKHLKKLGNTVVVVEHDEEIMRAADFIIDIGPLAGRLGGKVVFTGNHQKLEKDKVSLTAAYLNGTEKIAVPSHRRKWNNYIQLKGVRENNLKNVTVKFPLNVITVVTGVSGSGKSSLVKGVLYPALIRVMNGNFDNGSNYDSLSGEFSFIKTVEFVDQNPIGKSSRSNPVTYMKAYDEIRKLYSEQPVAQHFGFAPSHFSFNVDGGRCAECQGDGFIKVEMQFMADVTLICESCKGHRFKDDVLEVKYQGKNIYELLDTTIEDAIEFFKKKDATLNKKIAEKLQPLSDVGLGYVKLGQASSSLSGGESQRVKLASFLSKEHTGGNTLFIFDEPTTGLHFHDIRKLLDAFNALIKKGHSLIVIEHNPEVIKCADWLIDLGPEGGIGGGEIVFEGTPEEITHCKKSHTGMFLKEKIL